MSKANEPAFFGIIPAAPGKDPDFITGLTKREYFAAMAMQGFLANTESMLKESFVAEQAVKYADAVLFELWK